jgi:cold shock protein
MSAMQTGMVKFFDVGRGFGFIAPDNKANADVFFHITSLAPGVQPVKNERVEFSVDKGRDGKIRAAVVRIL